MKKKLAIAYVILLPIVIYFQAYFNFLTANLVLSTPILFILLLKGSKFLRSVYFTIFWNKCLLKRQIRKNRRAIRKLGNKADDLEDRLKHTQKIAEDVRTALDENIWLWKMQISVHHDIVSLLNLRIDRLNQHKAGISLLEYTVGQIKSEPDKEKLINKLEILIRKVDGKIDRDITNKINKLMDDLALTNREARIVQMDQRLAAIKQKVVL